MKYGLNIQPEGAVTSQRWGPWSTVSIRGSSRSERPPNARSTSAEASSMWLPTVRLFSAQTGHCNGDGQLSDRRPDIRAGAGNGRTAFYKQFKHNGVNGPNMPGLQRPRPWRAGSGGFLQPGE